MAKAEWFIQVHGKREGPYSVEDLKRHPMVTPDTLVWLPGLKKWVLMRHVPELDEVFADEVEGSAGNETIEESEDLKTPDDVLVAADPGLPPHLVLLLLTAAVLLFLLTRLYM